MSEVFSILLHNRQRYEQGKEGLWFSLPTTTEKLQEALREIGISADNPQDFFLYDYRSPQDRPIKLPRDLVLSADVDELNFLAARLEKLDAAELAELNAALTSPQSDFHSIGQIIDYPDNVDYYVHLPDVTGTGQLGDYYLNRSGMVDMPEEWKAGIFLPRFGLHIANTEHGVFTDYGYLVKSGDEWQRVHEGQPVPEEYRVMAYPALEILRDEAPAQTVQPEAAPTAEAAVPPPVVPIILNSQNSADRMKEITDRLETGIQELFESERYKAYLTSMAKFHSYSFNNTLLIAMQGGQLVAGYNKWRDDFHRNVKRGEKDREAAKAGRDFVVLEEVIEEIEAQYRQFKALTGREPDYFEGHAVASANFFKGLEIVAQHHGLPYFAMGRPGEAVIFRNTRVYAYMPRDFKAYEADPFTGVQDAVAHAHEGACDLMVFHPGYIDAYLLDHSTMTTPRVREAAMLCRPEVRAWLEQQDIRLVTYNDLT